MKSKKEGKVILISTVGKLSILLSLVNSFKSRVDNERLKIYEMLNIAPKYIYIFAFIYHYYCS